jgi:hypothetical protein
MYTYNRFDPQRINTLNGMNNLNLMGHQTLGYSSSHNKNLTHQFINEYFTDNGLVTPMMGATPTTGGRDGPVTIFDHIEIPTRNKKLTATKYICDFLKSRIATGSVPTPGAANSPDSISNRKYSIDDQKSSLMSMSGLEANFSDISHNPKNVSITYINPHYSHNSHHGMMMTTTTDPFSTYHPVNYMNPNATVNFSRRNYPDLFHNYDYRKVEHGGVASNKKASSTVRSKNKAKARVKSRSIDRALDERQPQTLRSKSGVKKQSELVDDHSHEKKHEESKETKASKHASKENEPEEVVIKKTSEKHEKSKHSEKSAFKKFTNMLNNTARKSRSPRLKQTSTVDSVVSLSNSSVTSDKSGCGSSKKEGGSSSSVVNNNNNNNNNNNSNTSSGHEEDESKIKTTSSQKTPVVAVKKTEVKYNPPPPAPPIDLSVFKPVVAGFHTLKKSTKMRIPIPDDTMTKTFDIVLDELKSKLARIRTSNEDLTNIDNLLHKPVVLAKEGASPTLLEDSIMKLIHHMSASDCGENWSNSRRVAKTLSCEAAKMDKVVLRHVTTNDSSNNYSRSSNSKFDCSFNAANRTSNMSSCGGGDREELKELIFITKNDSSYVNDEYQNQESIMRSINAQLNQTNATSVEKQLVDASKIGMAIF